MRWIGFCSGVVGVLAGVWWGQVAGAQTPLIDQATPHGTLLITADDRPGDRFAAQEIQTYLQKMTGVTLPITLGEEVPAGPVLVIGHHPASQPVIAELASRYPGEPESFAIVSRGERLHLVGQSDTATAWAAWGWLETLGVRWLLPTERGEHVPPSSRVTLEAIDRYEAAGMRFRTPSYAMPASLDYPAFAHAMEGGRTVGALYALRRRSNWFVGVTPGEGIRGVGGGHSYERYLPVERYFADHPEWFNLIDGKRQHKGNHWQVCFTSDAAAAEFAKNFLVDADRWLAAGYTQSRIKAMLSPNDFVAWCECEPCQKLVDTDGNASSMVFHFANQVARHVHAVYPEIPIIVYAYWNHTTPVTQIELAPNVIPTLTMWTASESSRANHAHPMFTDPNHRYRDYFYRWAEKAEGIKAYAYYGHYNWFIPYPQTAQMAHDIPIMAAHDKFRGLYSETHLHWSTQAPNFYLMNALMWDPHADAQAVLEDFYHAAYGPAAEAIGAYYGVLEAQMARQGYIAGEIAEVPDFLTAEVLAQCSALIAEARAHLEGMDPNTRWRTELVITGWENSEKFARAMALMRQPQSPEDRLEALALLESVQAFMATEEGKFAFERRWSSPQVERVAQPLRLNLAALPAGAHTWWSPAAYGGALNFWAQTAGLRPELWGYGLAPNRRGTLTLPLRAEVGRTITAARVRFDGPDAGRVSLQVTLAGAGASTTLAVAPNTFFEVPETLLGSELLTITVEVINHYHDPTTVITAVQLALTVE